MKTEISRDSHQPEKRYSGVYQQQGRMLTDADWNELVEILKKRLSDALKDVVGTREGGIGGTPRHRALRIVEDGDYVFKIQPGYVYVDGVAAQLPGDTNITYENQPDFPEPPAPTSNCVLYADVWERTVTHLMDERLRDKGLHGADTCTRKQTMAQVKWCPYDTSNPANPDNDPEQSAKNPAKGDAMLTVTLLQKTTQPDPCDPCASQLDVESEVGNYLFRVEVHHVIGDANDPSEITLKWSSENAAEQYALKNATGDEVEPPVEFKSGQWAYEFFDETSERHLGVHLATGFTPSRDELTEGYPATVPSRNFVRRWDGFCRLIKNSGIWEVAQQFDRNQSGVGSVSFTSIADGKLTVNLDAQTLILTIINNSFVAGDYWLAEVREAEHKEGDSLITDETPHGIEHHYLTLGKVEGGVLQPNPEVDRKYAFPPLTEMTRLFMAGGDGQEVMPGESLPQPLRVGVANGEWPVEGATVRFQIKAGGGSLSEVNGGKTNADGIAECEWSPDSVLGDACRVKATLVDPDHADDENIDLVPPVYFYANLVTADQVAYTSACPVSGENAVHSYLVTDPAVSLDLGTDDYYTVKEVLDALLCKLRARHIPYDITATNSSRWDDVNEEEGVAPPDTVQEAIDALLENLHSEDITYPLPDCSPATNTLRDYLKSYIQHDSEDASDRFRIKALWDALLCHLDAAKLPYNPNQRPDTTSRWRDIKEQPGAGDLSEPNTVQEAIDDLIIWLESTDIRYEVSNCGTAASPTVRSSLGISAGTHKINEILDKLLCDLKATDLPMDRSADLCDKLKNDAQVKSVQDAINALCLQSPRDAGCWVYVNVDTPLSETIKKLLEQNHTDICISLMPGTHELLEGFSLLDGHGISLRITGCGADTRLLLGPKPLHFRGLDSVEISNMKILGTAETTCLVKIDRCRNALIREIEAAARVAEKGTMLEINVPGSFRLENCVLEAFVPKSFEMPLKIFSGLELAGLFNFENLVIFDEILKEQAQRLAQLDPGEKKGLAGKIENRIQELAGMSDREASSYRSLIRELLQDEVEKAVPAEYSAHLKNIRIEAARANPGYALALLDLASDVIIMKNNIAGIVSLYGLPGNTALSAAEREILRNVREETRLKNLQFVGSAGSLRSHDNVLNRFAIGEEKVTEVKDMITKLAAGGGAELTNLYKTAYFRDNEIVVGNNMFLFQNLELNTTVFQAPAGEVGLALNSRAVYIGNMADHSSQNLVLLNITHISNDAGNLMLDINPPSP